MAWWPAVVKFGQNISGPWWWSKYFMWHCYFTAKYFVAISEFVGAKSLQENGRKAKYWREMAFGKVNLNRLAECQIFYTDENLSSKFYPKKITTYFLFSRQNAQILAFCVLIIQFKWSNIYFSFWQVKTVRWKRALRRYVAICAHRPRQWNRKVIVGLG